MIHEPILTEETASRVGGTTYAIVNPHSGKRGNEDVADALKRRFEADGRDLEIGLVGQDGDIEELAKKAVERGCATVIAAGGDGTISTVAEVLAGTDTALGVIPAGTFNYFARSFEIPEDIEGAVEVIATGTPRPTDVGWINDRIFLNNASVGIYSTIRRERERTYKSWGRSRVAAYWSVIKALVKLYKPMKVDLTVDGETRRTKTSLVFVCNSPFQLNLFELDGAKEVEQGKLAVFLSRDSGRWELLTRAFRLATKGMQRGRDFDLVTGKEITIDTGKPYRHIVRDGETGRMRGPFRFRLDAGGLKVIVPAANGAE
ncbi:diacylglycerol kinase family protein [Pseudoruegeria sp. HB172150]|uniref:diacylglycerol/lipid kinase family protein n=1 Tax=Pseudoruegeria sp. HB172150 TaxID=2721164 RepID=UPI00155362BB|nr:diacylglycerol kinase family protein [Pseudoruegeria sp. HB172150]